jgi:hypothetical protein
MSRSSSESTVPNGGGWLNRFPNMSFKRRTTMIKSICANDLRCNSSSFPIEVIRRSEPLSNQGHARSLWARRRPHRRFVHAWRKGSERGLTVVSTAHYHPPAYAKRIFQTQSSEN